MSQRRNARLKMLSAGVAAIAALSMLSACGGGGGGGNAGATDNGAASGNNGGSGGKGGSEAPYEISVMAPFYSAEPPTTDDSNPAFKAIEDMEGVKLDVTFVPGTTYNDKLNVTLASGNLPKVMVVLDNKSAAITNAVRSGAFWEVGPYIKDYPNLQQYWNDQIANNISVDGKVYGIYRDRPLARKGVIFRQDWLDNLGLEQPKSVDDLYKIAKAFTTDDPDKNGKNDTYGISVSDDNLVTDTTAVIETAMGGFNLWGLQDGKVTPDFMTEPYMEALKLLKQMYDEKLLNQDFGAIKGTKLHDNLNQGKAGMYFSSIDDANTRHADLFKLNPDAKIDFVLGLEGPDGVKMPANSGYSGVFMFPKSSVKTEDDLRRILAYFDKNMDPDVLKLFAFGVEGVHYKTENGNPVFTNEQLWKDQVDTLSQLRIAPSDLTFPTEPAVMQKVKKLYKEGAPNAVPSVIEPFISPTYAEIGAELDKVINDARVKFIMGDIDEAGFAQAVDQWKKQGGDKVIAEYTEAYNSANAQK